MIAAGDHVPVMNGDNPAPAKQKRDSCKKHLECFGYFHIEQPGKLSNEGKRFFDHFLKSPAIFFKPLRIPLAIPLMPR
jgi:hypothetical protein